MALEEFFSGANFGGVFALLVVTYGLGNTYGAFLCSLGLAKELCSVGLSRQQMVSLCLLVQEVAHLDLESCILAGS